MLSFMKKISIEKVSIFINIVVMLFFYQLIAIIYKNNTDIQIFNRTVLVMSVVILLIVFSKDIFKFKPTGIDILMSIVLIYMIFSLIIYHLFSSLLFSDMLKEILHSIVPFFIYYIYIQVEKKHVGFTINLIIISVTVSSLIGLLIFFNLQMPIFSNVFQKIWMEYPVYWRINSIYGVIVLGYLSQLMFSLILFNKYDGKFKIPLLIFFLIIAILTLQRAPIIGLMLSISVYTFSLIVKRKVFKNYKKLFLLIAIILIVILLLYIVDKLGILKFNVFSYVITTIQDINFQVDSILRKQQRVILNDSNIIEIFLGEGFGKYSPNNANATLMQPDASYFRIFNELGLVGFVLFFSIFIYFLLKAIVRMDFFMIYFITFTLIAFYYNRIIWAIPSNFVIFILLGMFESKRFNN